MKEKLHVWFFSDGKLGHINQLRGLAIRLAEYIELEQHWVDLREQRIGFKHIGRIKSTLGIEQDPDWVVGAGSKSHKPLLICKSLFGCKAVVLMKPSYPIQLFDAGIVPLHDSPPARANVLATDGVLNTLTPNAAQRGARGVIMVGGINKHFEWNCEAVIEQIRQIVAGNTSMQWMFTDSPRTPADFIARVERLGLKNLIAVSHRDTDVDWVKVQLESVSVAWVSRDSVSMVYECITSGVPTGLLYLPNKRQSRVVKGITGVIASERVYAFENWVPHMRMTRKELQLWEADRAASWLVGLFASQLVAA